jgi:uncharacterized repeat protein (TIGR03803 family)
MIAKRTGVRTCAVAAALGFAALLAAPSASAYKLKLLHTFCRSSSCPDGATPFFPPLQDSSGTVYGATYAGGKNNSGVVYSLLPGLAYKVLYRFCPKGSCKDGSQPWSPLIQDTSGDLFGTTSAGGTHGSGTVFELVPNADKSVWTHVTLHNFCPKSGCADGSGPFGNLTYQGAESGTPYDGTSPLYGSTQHGGPANDGVAFKLTFVSGQTARNVKVLHSFCHETSCTDGNDPTGLTIDGSGNLFGTTRYGGDANRGVLFELPSSGGEIVLYSFCQQAGCSDGNYPIGTPTLDGSGRLVGTAPSGIGGIVYRIPPTGVNSSETILYQFCSQASCADGYLPYGGIAIDASGDLFGSTLWGGAYASANCDGSGHGCGTVFKLHGSTEHVLHSFCNLGLPDCPDGAQLYYGPLFMDASGDIFGAAEEGGKYGHGAVFELTP